MWGRRSGTCCCVHERPRRPPMASSMSRSCPSGWRLSSAVWPRGGRRAGGPSAQGGACASIATDPWPLISMASPKAGSPTAPWPSCRATPQPWSTPTVTWPSESAHAIDWRMRYRRPAPTPRPRDHRGACDGARHRAVRRRNVRYVRPPLAAPRPAGRITSSILAAVGRRLTDVVQATIVAENALLEAEALAKSVVIAGSEDGLRLLARRRVHRRHSCCCASGERRRSRPGRSGGCA